ncbi:MAG: HAMP domain-containing histidine kinase [Flavobacteriales bacterium]|nr:HAMP domain-containing histidine kinase [Flavobacteriales bacterium]
MDINENKTKEQLNERIKELGCLYEITSIIVKSNSKNKEKTLKEIANSLKKAFQFPDKVEVLIKVHDFEILTAKQAISEAWICSNIKVFKKKAGTLKVFFTNSIEANFLIEEQLLLDNVAIKIGDFIERIETNQNEASLKRQMERADRLVILGELTAGIAHELNTPLANILGFAELLQEDFKNDKNALSDLDKIIQNTIFSREVVKKLMFFACEMPQEMKEVNLVPIIKGAIDLLDSSFRKSEVKYIVKIEKEVITLKADPIQLTQIIFNLVMNCIYFSPKGGLVCISAGEKENSVYIEISDQGKGFSEDALEKIFQPFYTTKPVGDGSGLGLSVVHGIVSSHKGKISVKNLKDKGACFTVILPK